MRNRADYQRLLRSRHRAMSIPDSVAHNRNTYSNWGCRCADCTTDHNQYQRNIRKTPPENFKHNRNGYSNWGCRCATCVTDQRAYDRQRRAGTLT